MLYKLDDYWQNTLLDSAKLTNFVHEKPTNLQDFVHIGDDIYIEVESLLGWIEELNYALEKARDDYEDLQNDLESNYQRISNWEMSGMSERDFY